MRLNGTEKSTLLALAARAILERIAPREPATGTPAVPTGNLLQKCGAFVSVYVEGELRGCIGTFSEEEELYKNVQSMAVSAATNDSRFEPIQAEELSRVQLEISILTPRQRIYDPSEIVIGKHGVFMKLGSKRGTLLPQVAVSQHWSVNEFLGNCARYKAGIGWDGWKEAELFVYEAIVFKEKLPLP